MSVLINSYLPYPVAIGGGGIELVGMATQAVAISSTATIDLTSLTGGIGSTALENDLVLVVWGGRDNANRTLDLDTAGYTKEVDLFADDTYDAGMSVSHKFMGVTPDTTVAATNPSISYTYVIYVYVWRGVDLTTPMDVTPTTATGVNTKFVDPPAITPTTAGNVMIACGISSGYLGSAVFASATDFPDHFDSTLSTDTNSGVGWRDDLPAGVAFDPAVWTSAVGYNIRDAWTAATLVLRPT
jgi:hypothetical protein